MKNLKEAGFLAMPGFGASWMETVTEMGSHMMSFAAARIEKDIQTQQELLHAKDFTEIQHIQAQFFQRAMDDYITKTTKLMKMDTALVPKAAAGTPV
jgi:t-SNARE complex subunit (syntaxin)